MKVEMLLALCAALCCVSCANQTDGFQPTSTSISAATTKEVMEDRLSRLEFAVSELREDVRTVFALQEDLRTRWKDDPSQGEDALKHVRESLDQMYLQTRKDQWLLMDEIERLKREITRDSWNKPSTTPVPTSSPSPA